MFDQIKCPNCGEPIDPQIIYKMALEYMTKLISENDNIDEFTRTYFERVRALNQNQMFTRTDLEMIGTLNQNRILKE